MPSNSSPDKPWYKSRTLWLNATAAGAIALERSLGVLEPHMLPGAYAAFSVSVAVANAMLRAVTGQPLRFRRGSRQNSPSRPDRSRDSRPRYG